MKTQEKLSLDFGLFDVDLNRILRFVKRDLNDDWFIDPLHFDDRLNKAGIIEYFKQNIERNNGIYRPTERIEINVPKKGDSLRYSLETCIYDRIAYHAFGEILIKHFDPLISRRVLNHRLDKISFNSGKPRYLYLSFIEQNMKFEEYVRVSAQGKTILQTDLQNYYENIRLDKLESILFDCLRKITVNGVEKARIRFCIESICCCLKTWSYNGHNGLPQNRDISSFLASMYLQSVDAFMIDQGFDYYRYMDDIKILCTDKYQARKALKLLINQVRKLGLNVNSAKTKIIEENSDEHCEFLESFSFDLERIDSMINSKKKPIVALGFQEVRDRLSQIVTNKEDLGKEFRFCVNRICKIALCDDIAKPQDFFTSITDCIVNLFSELPYTADQFYTYLLAVKMDEEQLEKLKHYLLAQEKSIYGWQNYLLWKLFVYHEFIDEELINFSIEMVKSCDNRANKAGALLYLGKFGDREGREVILHSFKNFNDFFLQRHALIAIQEEALSDVMDNVAEAIKPESIGIYRDLKRLSTPKYFEPPKKVKYTELIREVSFYV